MGGAFIVAPTPDERYKVWFDLMSVCRESIDKMSFDLDTGEVLFHARPDDLPSYLVAALSQDPAGYSVSIYPKSAGASIVDPWSSPPPPAGNVAVPLCARGAGAWPTFAGTLVQIDINYDATDYPPNQGYRGYDKSGNETPILAEHLLMFALGSASQIAAGYDRRTDVQSWTPYTVDPEVSFGSRESDPRTRRLTSSARRAAGPLSACMCDAAWPAAAGCGAGSPRCGHDWDAGG